MLKHFRVVRDAAALRENGGCRGVDARRGATGTAKPKRFGPTTVAAREHVCAPTPRLYRRSAPRDVMARRPAETTVRLLCRFPSAPPPWQPRHRCSRTNGYDPGVSPRPEGRLSGGEPRAYVDFRRSREGCVVVAVVSYGVRLRPLGEPDVHLRYTTYYYYYYYYHQ